MIQIILDESKRMGRLVTDLLDLARMESGHIRLQVDRFELAPSLARMTAKFEQVAKEQSVQLSFTNAADSPIELLADEDRLEQVLTNLIDNAIRHTPEGGLVDVRLTRANGRASVAVSDTGIGIAAEDIPFVFERFYKGDKARTRGKAGTGLGLAIAKSIAEAHGGAIRVESAIGKGTAFTLELPLAAE